MRYYTTLPIALLLAGCSSPEPTTESHIAGKAYRAQKELQGAIVAGVNYPAYGALVQQLSAEILILRDTARGTNDAAIADHYATALAIYMDAGRVWSQKIEDAGGQYAKITPKGRLLSHGQTAEVSQRYGIPVIDVRNDYGSLVPTISEDAIPQLWKRARLAAAKGDSLLLR